MNDQKLYEELVNWLDEVEKLPMPKLMTRDNTKWTIGTGDLIGAYQVKDLEIARKLKNRRRATQSTQDDVDNLLQSPANIVAMFSSHAIAGSGYDPKGKDLADNYERYQVYINAMLRNPMMSVVVNEGRKIHYTDENYVTLTENVTSLFDGISEFDAEKIKHSSLELLKTLTSSDSGKVKLVNFTQDVIDSRNKDTVYHMINTSAIEFTKKTSAGCQVAESYKSGLEVAFTRLKFNAGLFTREMAEKLLGRTEREIDDWLCMIDPKKCEDTESFL